MNPRPWNLPAAQQGFRFAVTGFDASSSCPILACAALEQQDDADSRLASFRLQQHWPEAFSPSLHRHATVGFPQSPVGTPTVENTYAKSVSKLHSQRREGIQKRDRNANTARSCREERVRFPSSYRVRSPRTNQSKSWSRGHHLSDAITSTGWPSLSESARASTTVWSAVRPSRTSTSLPLLRPNFTGMR